MTISPKNGSRHSGSPDSPAADRSGAVRNGTPTKPRPGALAVIPENVPDELKALSQWVDWRYDLTDKDEWAKVPYRCVGPYKASTTDPSSWGGFSAAAQRYLDDPSGNWAGVGFVFSDGDPYVGVDLDDCRDPETGRISDRAWEIVRALGSYTEVSPSGSGVKVILKAKKPGTKCTFKVGTADLGKVEVYDHARFFAITGHLIEDAPCEIAHQQAALDWIYTAGFVLDAGDPPAQVQAQIHKLDQDFAGASRRSGRQLSVEERAIAYLRRCPPAISGQGGHPTTFTVARAIVYGFDLGPEIGFRFLWTDYNPSCKPPWSERELRHKCKEADEKPFSKPRGYLLNQERRVGSLGSASPPQGGPGAQRVRHAGGAALEAQEPGEPVRPVEAPDDPHRLARLFVDGQRIAGAPTLRWHREEWFRWRAGAYCRLLERELRAEIGCAIKAEFDRLNRSEVADWHAGGGKGPCPTARKVSTRLTADIAHALAGLVRVDGLVEPPTWLDGPSPAPAHEVLACRSGVVHLPSWAVGGDYVWPSTPSLFTTNALEFDFDQKAPAPQCWLDFLHRLWPNDIAAVSLLQEWAGYLLLPDTSQQKIALLIGPRRSGKGTIGRILARLVGISNTCAPTLASLGTNFGLQPLLGKTLALISDARLSARTDAAIVVERLLSLSGEDAQTVDRKHISPVTTRLPVRFMILTNELPRLQDTSGALVGRLLILRMTESWYGREDVTLTDRLLSELSGILLWALEGWRRLRQRGHFLQPASAQSLLQQLENLSSPVGEFLRERCSVGPAQKVFVSDLYRAWRLWCESKGREATTEQTFGRDLHAAVPDLDVTQPRVGGSRMRQYVGVGLRDDAEEARAAEEAGNAAAEEPW